MLLELNWWWCGREPEGVVWHWAEWKFGFGVDPHIYTMHSCAWFCKELGGIFLQSKQTSLQLSRAFSQQKVLGQISWTSQTYQRSPCPQEGPWVSPIFAIFANIWIFANICWTSQTYQIYHLVLMKVPEPSQRVLKDAGGGRCSNWHLDLNKKQIVATKRLQILNRIQRL